MNHKNRKLFSGILGVAGVFSLSLVYFTSCESNKEFPVSEEPQRWEITDHEKLANIRKVTELYEGSIKEAIQTLGGARNSSESTLFVETFTGIFQDKIEKNFPLQGARILSDVIDSALLAGYEPAFLAIFPDESEANDDYSKEQVLTHIKKGFEQFANGIHHDVALGEEQKQSLLESFYMSYNIAAVTLQLGDAISGENEGNARVLTCGWFCRNKKRIVCTSLSVVAAATCTSNVAAAGTITLACIVATAKAVACWAEL